MHGHATVFVVLYCFFLFVSCLAFCVSGLGNWLGKRKVNGAQGELNETQQVM